MDIFKKLLESLEDISYADEIGDDGIEESVGIVSGYISECDKFISVVGSVVIGRMSLMDVYSNVGKYIDLLSKCKYMRGRMSGYHGHYFGVLERHEEHYELGSYPESLRKLDELVTLLDDKVFEIDDFIEMIENFMDMSKKLKTKPNLLRYGHGVSEL